MSERVAPIANTDYFELDSEHVGGRFGIWVTRPVGYDPDAAEPYPVLYVLDGQFAAAGLGAYVEWLAYDLIDDFAPFVAVVVGYGEEEAAQWVTLRNRDLVPPDEPLGESLIAATRKDAETMGWTPEEEQGYLDLVRNGHADRFLAFIERELAPRIARDYRVQAGDASLWGYSFGGLFALYALFEQSGLFSSIAAASPGVMTPESRIFELVRRAESAGGVSPVSLFLTLNASELTGKDWGYRDLAIQFARLVDVLWRTELPGLEFRSQVLAGESHATGWTQAFLAFVRFRFGLT
jgi:predicted alpha/beta superfamily hydrolase